MSRTCTSCERPLRKGSMRRALVLSPRGELERGLVCSRCALRALAFVVPPPTILPPACKGCKRRPACYCENCYEVIAMSARELVAANVTLAARHNESELEKLDAFQTALRRGGE